MITVRENIDLKPFNTFGIQARCDRWIDYTETSDIPEITKRYGTYRLLSIGGGSNLLFTRDFHGTIIHSRITGLKITKKGAVHTATIGAGERFDSVIERCCDDDLWGIENLSGIPGDTGAAAVQNIGAYGVEIKDVIETVDCYDTLTGKFITLTCDDCGYGYRSSIFKNSDHRFIVTAITVRLNEKPSPRLEYAGLNNLSETGIRLTPHRVREEIIRLRDTKLPDPATIGNAGSFFKNPVLSAEEYDMFLKSAGGSGYTDIPHYDTPQGTKIPAAWLIEQSGFKGRITGNAGVWHKQPLVLINATGHATGQDITNLENEIIQSVYKKFGIHLHPEVEHI